jgi:hypothetical protein
MLRADLLITGILLLAAGCSHRPKAPEGFYLLSEIDRPPVLRQCHGYIAPAMGRGITIVGVPVRFDVTAEGRVVNARARTTRLMMNLGPTEVVEPLMNTAELAASTCEYFPGTLAGHPVAVHDFGMTIILPFRQ